MQLALLWALIRSYQLEKAFEGERSGGGAKQDLLFWVRSKCQSYNVEVPNFRSGFSDGLALCALLHTVRPDVFEYELSSDPMEVTTFCVDMATRLGVPRLLEPEDLVREEGDEQSIATYVSYWRSEEEKMRRAPLRPAGETAVRLDATTGVGQKAMQFEAIDRKAKEEAEAEHRARLLREEARRAAEDQARLVAEEQARRAAEDQARRAAEDQARKAAAEEQARRAAEEQARRAAEEQARRAAEEQARRAAEEQARRAAEEQARRAAEEQARRAAEEQARRAAEEQARRAAEEQARRAADEQARRAAEEQARRAADEQARRAAEEQARRAAEEQARRAAEEQAEQARRAAEQDQERRRRTLDEERERLQREFAQKEKLLEAERLRLERLRFENEDRARQLEAQEQQRRAEAEAEQRRLQRLKDELLQQAQEADRRREEEDREILARLARVEQELLARQAATQGERSLPSPRQATKWIAIGDGMGLNRAQLHAVNTFRIQLLDPKTGQPGAYSGPGNVQLSLANMAGAEPAGTELQILSVDAPQPGVFLVSYSVAVAESQLASPESYGDRHLSVTIDGMPLQQSPFLIASQPPSELLPAEHYDVCDATNNKPIYGASVVLINNATGAAVYPTPSAAGGFDFSTVPDGAYVLHTTAQSGYTEENRAVLVFGGQLRSGKEVVFLNPSNLLPDQIRIVLSWKALPPDLDAHLSVDSEHILWSHRSVTDGSAVLDVDVRDGHGPETITVRVKPGSSYHFFVENYSEKGNHRPAGSLAHSGAIIRVYGAAGLLHERLVPNQVIPGGFWWDVFRITPDGQLVWIDEITATDLRPVHLRTKPAVVAGSGAWPVDFDVTASASFQPVQPQPPAGQVRQGAFPQAQQAQIPHPQFQPQGSQSNMNVSATTWQLSGANGSMSMNPGFHNPAAHSLHGQPPPSAGSRSFAAQGYGVPPSTPMAPYGAAPGFSGRGTFQPQQQQPMMRQLY
eukprot:TRINITY_DN1076_c0_g1_i5.p1 TRINITY_DN1076_c0_g1~~TRINITY_DN1076_c0_g1_i5.p1  ORF type:complete len:1083 (+),score=205.69 TRINITY_DN1076_c0_g1_i5:318-3251(+)